MCGHFSADFFSLSWYQEFVVEDEVRTSPAVGGAPHPRSKSKLGRARFVAGEFKPQIFLIDAAYMRTSTFRLALTSEQVAPG
jgi:hypothetical protein